MPYNKSEFQKNPRRLNVERVALISRCLYLVLYEREVLLIGYIILMTI